MNEQLTCEDLNIDVEHPEYKMSEAAIEILTNQNLDHEDYMFAYQILLIEGKSCMNAEVTSEDLKKDLANTAYEMSQASIEILNNRNLDREDYEFAHNMLLVCDEYFMNLREKEIEQKNKE